MHFVKFQNQVFVNRPSVHKSALMALITWTTLGKGVHKSALMALMAKVLANKFEKAMGGG